MEVAYQNHRVRPLARKQADDWRGLSSEGTWITHLNDLRFISSGYDETQWLQMLIHELKVLSIFHGKRLIVPDSDLNNNPSFQTMFLNDVHKVRTAFTRGRLVLALRDTAEGLGALNLAQGPNRADAGMLERTKPFAAAFDAFYHGEGLVAVEWKLQEGATSFADAVTPFYADPLSPLANKERDILRAACSAAVQRDPNGRLMFGRIYPMLLDEKGLPPSARVIQAVRAAFNTNLALRLGFSPSVPLSGMDPAGMDPALLRFAVRRHLQSQGPAGPVEEYINLLPRMIPTENDLDSLSFEDIPRLQWIGDSIGYFASLEKAKNLIGSDLFYPAYIDYLKKLGAYIKGIKIERQFVLADWQSGFLEKYLDEVSRGEFIGDICAWVVPVVLLLSSSVLLGIDITTMAGSTGLIVHGARLLPKGLARQKRAAMAHLLRNTTTLPAS